MKQLIIDLIKSTKTYKKLQDELDKSYIEETKKEEKIRQLRKQIRELKKNEKI